MKNTTISDRDAFELAYGRVPARPDLDSLADLLTAYRSAAIGSAPRPSAALSARLDLSATPIAMRRDAVADGRSKNVTARAASGLLGVGVVAAIILGAASGAAAVVGAGSAGLLPPGAQQAFDQVVSAITPLGVAGQDTTDQGEAPADSTGDTTSGATVDKSAVTENKGVEIGDDSKSATIGNSDKSDSGNGNSGKSDSGNGNSGNGNSGNGNSGNGNSGNGNGNSGNGSNGSSGDSGISNSGNGNSGNGNSGNGNGNSGQGNSGNGNGNSNSGGSGKSGKDD